VKYTVYASFRPSTATSSWLPVKWRHFRVTSGHLRSRDVSSCHVTASSRELQPCKKWNIQYTPVFGLLQPLPADFRSNNATSGSLPVTWGHVTSFPVTWLPPGASYSLVGSEMYNIGQLSVFYNHFQVTSGQMTSPPGHFRSPEVTWRHSLSHDCLLLRATALQEVKCTVYTSFRISTATSRWLPLKWRHFQVTSGHIKSHDVIFCHVTAFSCELQPCRKWNVQNTQVFDLRHPIPNDLRSNYVTSGSLPVTWGHVTSLTVTWLPPCASYSLVGSEMYIYASFGLLQPLPGDFRSNDVTSGSLPVTWGHVMTFPVTWLAPPSSYCLVRGEMYSIRQFSAFYSHF